MTPLLLLLWVVVSMKFAVNEAEASGFAVSARVGLHKRIVGGQPCGNNERHYHVRLSSIGPDGTVGNCGGSLIWDRWVLTAAHCWEKGRTMFAVVGVHPGPGQRVEIISEPVIYKDNNNQGHDLMLLQLPYPTNIQPVGHPDCTKAPKLGQQVSIAGHGATTTGSFKERQNAVLQTLHCGQIQLVDCTKFWSCMQKDPFISRHHVICGQSATVDISHGDSGGGVVYNNKIYGVISFGASATHACAAPAAFIDLCHKEYNDWIGKTIGTYAGR